MNYSFFLKWIDVHIYMTSTFMQNIQNRFAGKPGHEIPSSRMSGNGNIFLLHKSFKALHRNLFEGESKCL